MCTYSRTRLGTFGSVHLYADSHRISVLFAMLRDGTFYEARGPETAHA